MLIGTRTAAGNGFSSCEVGLSWNKYMLPVSLVAASVIPSRDTESE